MTAQRLLRASLLVAVVVLLAGTAFVWVSNLAAPVQISFTARSVGAGYLQLTPEGGSRVLLQRLLEPQYFETHRFRFDEPGVTRLHIGISPEADRTQIHFIRLKSFFREYVWKADDILAEFTPDEHIERFFLRDMGYDGPNDKGERRHTEYFGTAGDPRQTQSYYVIRRDVAQVEAGESRGTLSSPDLGPILAELRADKSGYYVTAWLLALASGLVFFRMGRVFLGFQKKPFSEAFAWELALAAGLLLAPFVVQYGLARMPSTSLFFAAFWASLVLLSMVGWGGLLARTLFRGDRPGWSLEACWGMALLLLFGGVLNACGLISAFTAGGLVYIGVGLMGWEVWRRRADLLASLRGESLLYRREPWLLAIAGAVAVLFAVNIGAGLHTDDYGMARHIPVFYINAVDDMSAYAVYPERMLATGSLGVNPMGERQVTSSFGGQYFLHTLLLSKLAPEHLMILEVCAGFLLFFALLYGHMRAMGISRATGMVLLLLAMLLLVPPVMNTSSHITGMVLLLALFRTVREGLLVESRPIRNAFVIALLTAGICSLKNSYVPPTGLFIAASYAFYLIKGRNKISVLVEGLAAAGFVLVFTAPWLYAFVMSSGDLAAFFSNLGSQAARPSEGSARDFWSLLPMYAGVLRRPIYLGLILLCAIAVFFRPKHDPRNAMVADIIGTLGSLFLTILSLHGFENPIYRYSYPINMVTIAIVAIYNYAVLERSVRALLETSLGQSAAVVRGGLARIGEMPLNAPLRGLLRAAPVLALLYGGYWLAVHSFSPEIAAQAVATREQLARKAALLQSRLTGEFLTPMFSRADYRRARSMQAAAPAGAAILARLDTPALLDFTRNPIHIVDFPSDAALPPGHADFTDAEAIAGHLRSRGIRYVAYAYGNEALFTYEKFKFKFGGNTHTMAMIATRRALDFQAALHRLGSAYTRLHDDGHYFLLDLEQPVEYGALAGFGAVAAWHEDKGGRKVIVNNLLAGYDAEGALHLRDESAWHVIAAEIMLGEQSLQPGQRLVVRVEHAGGDMLFQSMHFGLKETRNGLMAVPEPQFLPASDAYRVTHTLIRLPDNILPDRPLLRLGYAIGNFDQDKMQWEPRALGEARVRSVAVADADTGVLLGAWQATPLGEHAAVRALAAMPFAERVMRSNARVQLEDAVLGEDGIMFEDDGPTVLSKALIGFRRQSLSPGQRIIVSIVHSGDDLMQFQFIPGVQMLTGRTAHFGAFSLPAASSPQRLSFPARIPFEAREGAEALHFSFTIGLYNPWLRAYDWSATGKAALHQVAVLDAETGEILGFWDAAAAQHRSLWGIDAWPGDLLDWRIEAARWLMEAPYVSPAVRARRAMPDPAELPAVRQGPFGFSDLPENSRGDLEHD